MRGDPPRPADGRSLPTHTGSMEATGALTSGGGNGRLQRPEMLMIGATGRNTGKTELACRIIRRYAASVPIAGLKVTTVERADGSCPHGGEGCGACSSLDEPWCLTRELDDDSGKDTSRLLASGAREAYWLRVKHGGLVEGAEALLARVPLGYAAVCESNSLSTVVEPGLFLQVRAASERTVKPSARTVAHLADCVVVADGAGFDLPLDRISLLHGQWALRREACAVVVGDPLAASDLSSLGAQFSQVEVVGVPADAGEDRGVLRALAVGLSRSGNEWCLVAREWGGAIPAGLVNAMFRRRDGVQAVLAQAPVPPHRGQLVLAHRSLLPGIARALESSAPSLASLGRVRELTLEQTRLFLGSERV